MQTILPAVSLLAAFVAAWAMPAAAAETKPPVGVPAGGYDLFHPVPAGQLRDMSTDRPDTTESPYTVDAGHFQVEMSVVDFAQDRDRGSRTSTWSFGQMNLKAGLTPDSDIQFLFDTYSEVGHRPGGTGALSGFSDITVRLKMNFWGNDGGRSALGLMPFISIPTGGGLSGRRLAGGLILPFAMSLSDRIELGLMGEVDLVPDDVGSGYEAEWVHSATLGFDLTDQLGLYLEAVGVAGSNGYDYEGYFNSGFTFALTRNFLLDTGLRMGLNHSAEDLGVFVGMSIRF